jgi:hypothetical protein
LLGVFPRGDIDASDVMAIFVFKRYLVCYSPDRADILPQSRRAREIKAKAGLVLIETQN